MRYKTNIYLFMAFLLLGGGVKSNLFPFYKSINLLPIVDLYKTPFNNTFFPIHKTIIKIIIIL